MFFVHEHALRSLIGGPRVMNEQLLHLLFMGNGRSAPFGWFRSRLVRWHEWRWFLIFGYKEDPSLVYVSHATTSEFLKTDNEVVSYRNILNRVASVALDGAHSRELLLICKWLRATRRCTSDAGGLAEE